MMVQYLALKAEVPDCLLFYRIGDFFELFFDDARAAARTLDIALTARGEHGGAKVPMCGVPVHSHEAYLARLIKAGHRVAIAEQTETPEQARKRGGTRALVARGIVRIVTAGTLTEEVLLDARAANWLAAVWSAGGEVGLAAADISTGRLELGCVPAAGLSSELSRLSPAELIACDGFPHPLDREATVADGFDPREAERLLKALFGVSTLDGWGAFGRPELAAMGGLLHYLDRAGQGAMPLLQPPVRRTVADHLALDAATRDSLELTCASDGGRKGSLLDAVDRTVTGAGARLLAQDLAAPLADRAPIDRRLDLVAALLQASDVRERLRGALRALPDIGRALGRVAAGRGSPRDLGQLRDGLGEGYRLRDLLATLSPAPALLTDLLPALTGHGALIDGLTRALVPTPPIEAGGGGYIAEGYDAALDALRASGGEGRRAIAALEACYRQATGVAQLRIRHNNVLGYHVEVPAKGADTLMRPESGFTHRQTLAGVVRFNAPELHEQALAVGQAGAHALAAEAAHLEELIGRVLAAKQPIARTADALARLDVAAGLAERAMEGGWCRPALVDHPCLEIADGRHPVVESAVGRTGERFVANDCRLGPHDRLWLVTGPNMGGKSTFLRQNAVMLVLAQAGSFVPASSATIGLCDKLFSRVGASDNLARGRSTFMVEMVETAAILAQATERSFVILDEVGRGTSTYDGLAIAWAVAEAVHDANRCRCLFATHYHELTRLAERLDALSLHHVRAREWKGSLVLLHEVAAGPADRSYGLAVARLAGLPPPVVARAKAVLKRLEAGRAATGGLAAGLDDLPLFAAAMEADAAPPDRLREALAEVDGDALTPREALALVYRLKALAEDGASR
jgi:DNA mismatch repair protein MutS